MDYSGAGLHDNISLKKSSQVLLKTRPPGKTDILSERPHGQKAALSQTSWGTAITSEVLVMPQGADFQKTVCF